MLTDASIIEIWRTIFRKGQGKQELKVSGMPDRATRDAEFRAMDDIITASGVAMARFIATTVITNPRSVRTKAFLDDGRIAVELVDSIEEFLEQNPPVRTNVRLDEDARDGWIAANQGLFQALAGTQDAKDVMVRGILNHHIKTHHQDSNSKV